MKVTCILFAVYLLSLAVHPCNDQETCRDEIKTGYEQIETDNHEHSNAEQDFCSPFCICQCCSIQAQQAVNVVISLPDYSSAETINTYFPQAVKILPHSFWQPPRVG